MTHPSWQPWPPWQGSSAPQPWSGPSAPSMLASHADRERAVDVLRAGYGEGRLEQPEFEKRVTRAYTARTVGELALLVSDLPQGPMPQPAPVTPVPGTFLASPRPQTNSKAVGSAVCGVLCLVSFGLTGIPAVVLGHAARTEIRRTGQGGDALALTGLVLGWLSTAGWVVLLTLLMVAAAVSESGAG
ncbi:DUF1707 and DUF4190 domain-containing protein [Streptomyces sp. uw30]|uniref:DUF1707 and DUF4190 domain-containing protein n=1 Tax=Streptomyces sp. uw30 TaxID=1828179 RepID=UPI0011CE6F0D|nr:DUF1707 and DUF4190 domain-containing protein [Streptomyces sp. uw30]TXS50604.1 DUF1707 and DUF4190 domain-containing protein [Streptomyces sp. uw30]